MDQNQRRARVINMRQGKPLPHLRTRPVPATVLADLDAIDAATQDPIIHTATARIRAALDGTTQRAPRREDNHMPDQDVTMQDVDPVDTWGELRDEQFRHDAEAEAADSQEQP